MPGLPHRVVAVFAAVLLVLTAATPGYARHPAVSLPATSDILDGYDDTDSVKHRLIASGLHHVEGIWQYPDDGAVIVIERDNRATVGCPLRYNMVVLKSPRRSIAPGTLMGKLAPTAKKDTYAASIYSTTLGTRQLTASRHYTATLSEGSRLMLQPKHGIRLRLNAWRMIPYLSNMISVRVQPQTSQPDNLDGCIKIFPTPLRPANGPRYL